MDTAESAESAMAYLTHHRPDVIFMDHLMPGMDGFQAVQAIKNNPRTATIPIMMYTSQEGELYVGQARALGAVGVLPKLVKPVDVSKVLYQLHLLPDRRDTTPPAFVAREPRHLRLRPRTSCRPTGIRSSRPRFATTTRSCARFVVATLDSFADRITSDVRHWINESTAQDPPPAPAQAPPYWWIAGVLAAVADGCGFYRPVSADARHQPHAGRRKHAVAADQLAACRSLHSGSASFRKRRKNRAGCKQGPCHLRLRHHPAAIGESRPVPYGEPPLALGPRGCVTRVSGAPRPAVIHRRRKGNRVSRSLLSVRGMRPKATRSRPRNLRRPGVTWSAIHLTAN